MSDPILIYGAYGFTGKLCVERARALGLAPVLAGRDAAKLAALAEPLQLEHHAVGLDETEQLRALLTDKRVVLHTAGPFSATSTPMIAACLASGTHYLDITGEIDVFEAAAARDAEAKAAGVMLMPGCGFDVVPSDCLAVHVAAKLPDATMLRLGISINGGPSRGTLKSAFQSVGLGPRVRRKGEITELDRPLSCSFDWGRGERTGVSTGWGDVATAYHTTGIGEIDVFFERTKDLENLFTLQKYFGWFLGSRPGQAILRAALSRAPEGPDAQARAADGTTIVAEVENAAGEVVRARLTGLDGYTFTALAAVEIARRVMAGEASPGYRTPGQELGADFPLRFEGMQREDL